MARPKLHQLLDGVSEWNEDLRLETRAHLENLSVGGLKGIIAAAGQAGRIPRGTYGVKPQLLYLICAISPSELLDAYDLMRGKRTAEDGQLIELDQEATIDLTLPLAVINDPEFLSVMRRYDPDFFVDG